MHNLKRSHPRVPVEALCSELVAEREQYGLIVDMSETGVRIQRPLSGPRAHGVVQLEFELPEVDEIIWAKGEMCFDQFWRVPSTTPGGQSTALRTSGIHLVSAATKHLRMLRDYV